MGWYIDIGKQTALWYLSLWFRCLLPSLYNKVIAWKKFRITAQDESKAPTTANLLAQSASDAELWYLLNCKPAEVDV